MANNETSIIISAVDKTEGALKSVSANVGALEGQFSRLSGVVSGFAALAGVTAFSGLIKGAIDTADKLYDVSQQTGASVESLSAMSGAAKLAGVDMETVAGGLTKLSKNMLDAADGTGNAAKLFNALGINVKDSAGKLKSTDTVMLEFAKSLQNVSSGSERAAAAQVIFGKSGALLLPLFSDLAQKSQLQAKYTTEQARAANELNDTLELLGRKSTAWAVIVANDVVPSALAFSTVLLDLKTSADGTKNAVSALSSDGSIREWAMTASIAAGHVVDELRLIGKIAIEIATPIERLARNLYNVGALASIALSGAGPSAMKSAYEDLERESEKHFSDLDSRLKKNRENSPLFADRIKDQVSVMESLRKQGESIYKTYIDAGYSVDIANAAVTRFRKSSSGEGWDYGNGKSIAGALGETAKDAAKALEALRISEMMRIHKEAAKELETMAKAQEDYAKALQAALDPLEQQARNLEREVQNYGLTESAIQATAVARLEEARAIAAANGAWPEHLNYLDQEIEARKRIGSASSQKEFLDANKKAAEQSAKEWEKFSDDINRALTDALMRGFESGKSFGQNFVDSLKNSLKTAALKIVVNYVTNGAGQLVGTVGNAAINSVLGTSSANGGAGTNYLGVANNLSTANNLYSAGSQFLTGSSVGASNASLIYANGVQTLGGDGIGALYTANGGWAGVPVGEAAAPASTGASAVSSVAWIAAIVAGMYMSSEAWKAGIRWENYAKDKDAQKYDAEVGIRALHDEPARAVFGDKFVDSQFYAIAGGGSLSAQIHGALQKAMWGGKQQLTGITSLKGAFVENGDGDSFVGQAGQEWKQSGGWFRGKDSSGVDWQNVTTSFQDSMSDMYKGIRNSMLLYGAAFGDTTLRDKIKGFVSLIDVKNANNMPGVQEALANQIAQGLGELMFPSIGALQQTVTKNGMAVAESWSEIFGRVMQEVAATGSIFELLGKNIFDIFGTGNADRVLKLSDNFVQLFGSIDSMNQRIGAYYENFYTAQEKTDYGWEKMQQAFDGIQQVMPTTREGFRKLVDSLDLATESGGAAFKALMDLQGGFAALTPEIVSLTEAQKKAQLTEQLGTALNTAKSVTDAAFAALERAVAAEKTRLTAKFEDDKKAMQTSIDAAKTSVGELTNLFDTISAAVGTLVEQTDAQLLQERGAAQSALTAAVTAASNGQSLAPFAASITGAIETLKKPSENLYGSFEDYARAQGQANAALVALKNSSADQKSVQEMMLQALEDSLALQQTNYDNSLAELDAKVQSFKDQIDALRGIDNSVKSVESAIKDLAAALKKETTAKAAVNVNAGLVGGTTPTGDYLKDVIEYGQKYGSDAYYFGSTNDFTAKLEAWTMQAQALGVSLQEASGGQYSYFLEMQKQFDAGLHPTAASGGAASDYTSSITDNIAAAAGASSAAQIENLYSNLLGRASDAGGLASWQSQLDAGVMTIAAIAEAFKNSDEYKNSHATGLDRVPFDGYQATLHQGEAVVDAASVAAIQRYFKITPLQSGGNSEEIRALREEQRAQAAAFAAFMSRFTRIVEKWDGDGMPSVRVEA